MTNGSHEDAGEEDPKLKPFSKSNTRRDSSLRQNTKGNDINQDVQRETLGTIESATPDTFDGKVSLDNNLEIYKTLLKINGNEFIIWDLKPEDVSDLLNRQQKRIILRELADVKKYPKGTVCIKGEKLPKDLKKQFKLSRAAILIIGIALKGGERKIAKADERATAKSERSNANGGDKTAEREKTTENSEKKTANRNGRTGNGGLRTKDGKRKITSGDQRKKAENGGTQNAQDGGPKDAQDGGPKNAKTDESGTADAGQDKEANVFNPMELFAELVGCATPDTLDELTPFLRPPLIDLKTLPKFIHCAVRQIARSTQSDRSPQPVKLAIQTTRTIANVLKRLEEFIDEEESEPEDKLDKSKRIRALVDEILKRNDPSSAAPRNQTRRKSRPTSAQEWATDFHNLLSYTLRLAVNEKDYTGHKERTRLISRDLGCHTSLLLAGMQRYFIEALEDHEAREALCELFIESCSGLLTGAPIVGFLFGPAGSIAKFAYKKQSNGKSQKIKDLYGKVQQEFDESVAGPVFFDGKFVMKGKKPRKEDVEWGEFSKWYEQVFAWNQATM